MKNTTRASLAVIAFLCTVTTSLLPWSARAGASPSASDTLVTIPGYIPNYASRDTFVIVGKKVTLREIIRRAVAGERGKLGGHRDMTYTMTTRSIVLWDRKKRVEDNVLRAYADAGGNARTLALGHEVVNYKRSGDDWNVSTDDDDDDPPPVRVTSDGIEFSRVPFFLEDEHEYDFTLLERRLESDRVIFKIGFAPKSSFKPLPSGVVYVDTHDYRIVHEEFRFDKNPFPLFLKGVDRISRHWEVLSGGECVFTKLIFEASMRADPFGLTPHTVSMVLERSDFRFDEGYDARLFGELDGVSTGGEAGGAVQQPAAEQFGPLVATLQREDQAHYPSELFADDSAHRRRVIAEHDSLGLERYREFVDAQTPWLRRETGVAADLWTYNRVEGMVGGLSRRLFARRNEDGPTLDVGAAWATGSKRVRHRERLTLPIVRAHWRTSLTAAFADQVTPYGSNRPVFNSLRALVASEDKQDYLRRERGRFGVDVEHDSGVSAGVQYQLSREHSADGTTDFSFFGEMRDYNAPIDAGVESAVVLQARWRAHDSRLALDAEERFAGGALGGDFEYTRADALVGWRRFIVGRHELVGTLRAAVTTGGVPVQQLADAGGLTTVRGYERRTLLGRSSLCARLEYLFPYDLLGGTHIPLVNGMGVQLVPWADAGRVWEGNDDEWIHSAGIGFQLFLGAFGRASNLRLDVAFPTRSDARDDVRVDLSFAPIDL